MTHMTAPDPLLDSQFYDGVPARRLVAFCIDVVVVFAIWCVVLLLGLILTVVTLGLGAPLAALAASVTDFLYRWILLAQGSATLGMRLTGVEIRDSAGRRLDAVTAFLHVAGFYVTLFFLPLLVIGWVLMAATPHRRLLHDIPLGAVAINRPA
ncbi:MAG TPA: RDD family protein [Paracoccaceae bacterium]|nr:RDD family protein [Paracoccaceae bacterium]